MVTPKRTIEIGDDDIQDVENDIQKLKTKYLTPIDNVRSYGKPGPVFSEQPNAEFQGLQTDNQRPLESRIHAFYRFIGFPVATSDGFYNPGHRPGGQFLTALDNLSGAAKRRANVDKKFQEADFISAVQLREDNHELRRSVFARKDANSSLYAILLRERPPFQVLDENKGPFDPDEQSFNVDSRTKEADNFLNDNPNFIPGDVTEDLAPLISITGNNFAMGFKILRPFVVDPRVEVTVQPDNNRMAVPFLATKEQLVIEKQGKTNISVLRPGIELIIRERLRKSSDEAVSFLETLERIADNEVTPANFASPEGMTLPVPVDIVTLRNTVEALLGDNDIEISSVLELQGITTVQVRIIVKLVKQIKAVINQLHLAIAQIDLSRDLINWVPFPSSEGPEQGDSGAILNEEGISTDLNKLASDIKFLRIKFITETRRVSEEMDIGGFAYPEAASLNTSNISSIKADLDKKIKQRNKIANDAFKAMGRIDLITGEISGLGLINVLSIYIALWSMDEISLISLLDDESFERLVNNFDSLVVGAAADRRDAGTKEDIETALRNFEDKLINVLTFADNEFNRQFVAPGEEPGGDIFANS